jgi:hypothetical protein
MAKEIVTHVGCEVVVLNPGKLALYLRFYYIQKDGQRGFVEAGSVGRKIR